MKFWFFNQLPHKTVELHEEFRFSLTNHKKGQTLGILSHQLVDSNSSLLYNFKPNSAHALIGYFDITWYVKMNLFRAKG